MKISINQINDKQELEFSCFKAINVVKEFSDLKNPVTQIRAKGKKLLFFYF